MRICNGGSHIQKEDEKKYYSFIITLESSVFKLGKTPFFSSIRDKKESVEESYFLEIPYSPGVEWNRNAALEIDLGSPLIIAREEDLYIINVLKPGLGH